MLFEIINHIQVLLTYLRLHSYNTHMCACALTHTQILGHIWVPFLSLFKKGIKTFAEFLRLVRAEKKAS